MNLESYLNYIQVDILDIKQFNYYRVLYMNHSYIVSMFFHFFYHQNLLVIAR